MGHILEDEKLIYNHYSTDPPLLMNDDETPFRPTYYNLDGFYVGKKPETYRYSYHKEEQRLYWEGGMRWFGPDGRMDNLLDPLKLVDERSPRIYDPKVTSFSIFLLLNICSFHPIELFWNILRIIYEILKDLKAEYMQTRFVDPVLPTNASGLSLSVKENYFQLEVDFQDIRIWNYPLFMQEDMLASKLEVLYLEWNERRAMDLPKCVYFIIYSSSFFSR